MSSRLLRVLAPLATLVGGAACGSSGPDPEWPMTFELESSRSVPCAYGVAVGPNNRAYATSICERRLSQLDRATGTVSGNVEVGASPAHVAIDPAGATLYTTDQHGRSVSVIGAAAGQLLATIPVPGAREAFNLIVSRDGRRVYFTTNANRLYVIDAPARRIVDSAVVGLRSNGLAFHPTEPLLYVSSIEEGIVVALSTATLAETRRYTVGGMPQRLAVAPDGQTLYASNETSGFNVVNLATGAVSSVPVGGRAIGMAMHPSGTRAYVAIANTGVLRVMDLATRTVSSSLEFGLDLRNVAIAPDDAVLVADQLLGRVHIVRP